MPKKIIEGILLCLILISFIRAADDSIMFTKTDPPTLDMYSGSQFIRDLNDSTCYNMGNILKYNFSINSSYKEERKIKILLNLCYNKTNVYCYSDNGPINSSIVTLFKVNSTDYICSNGMCLDRDAVPNPFTITNETSEETTIFICYGIKKQDGQYVFAYNALNYYLETRNNVYFNFDKTSFRTYEVTNITINNITELNSTYIDKLDNLSANLSNIESSLSDIKTNLSSLETRLSTLELWAVQINSVISYLLSMVNSINAIFSSGSVCYSNGTNCPVGLNNTNLTNITLPDNQTNITLPDNQTNITLPDNHTNITLPDNQTNITLPDNLTNITLPDNYTNGTNPDNETVIEVPESRKITLCMLRGFSHEVCHIMYG